MSIVVPCLTGPTAAGKSASTLALAQRWPIEVINMDSATIYRGMDIGTAKPSTDERARLPQHLLDIRDPAESYSAAAFRQDALALIADIRARGRLPLLCGGTLLYYKTLREGLDDLPQADAALRADIERQAAELGWPALHRQLAILDPATAHRLSPNDSQRIQRALEICRLSGQPMSSLLTRQTRQEEEPYQYVTISLEPSDRSILHARIAQRYLAMMDAGLLAEVAALHARSDLHPGMPSVRCVGYRQLWSYLDGDTTLDDAVQQAIAATRRLAKRQLTWLRSLPDRQVIDCLGAGATSRVVDALSRYWA
ncbi:MAG TPA: tRNA (adenosine(37)-N6)-dimethylallyltransferase MiaA [Burkholderiaceae bacterium]|nr:tRNA (adenosine(37)-N6)-dimethylallyltransferase MiaA [Burkholderiaceae bacterium]